MSFEVPFNLNHSVILHSEGIKLQHLSGMEQSVIQAGRILGQSCIGSEQCVFQVC